ncbi:MAG: hypothetical protein GX853_07120 [Chloroflexi bacterium]|nr:hypothetical protein [Chloroflexota bacterium]
MFQTGVLLRVSQMFFNSGMFNFFQGVASARTPPQAWFIAMLGYFYTLVFVVHAEVKQLCVLPLMPNQKI